MSIQFNNVVAMKSEVGVMKGLRHENVVKFLGATRGDIHFNIFMEYLQGGCGEWEELCILDVTRIRSFVHNFCNTMDCQSRRESITS